MTLNSYSKSFWWTAWLAVFLTTSLSGHTSPANNSNTKRATTPYQRGWNFVCWYKNCVDWEVNEDSIKRLSETGASHFVLVVNWYVSNTTDPFLRKNIPKQEFEGSWEHQTYSDVQIARLATWAAKYQMKIVVKPHVEIIDKEQTFRGLYNPSDENTFYTRYLDYYSQLLKTLRPFEKNISDIVVGTELSKLSQNTERWRTIIRQLKKVGPKTAKFTYASNWFDFNLVDFWDELDWIGVDAYYPLSFVGTPTVDSMVSAWRIWGTMLTVWRDHYWPGKPIGFTETGFVDNKNSTRFSMRAWANTNSVDEDEHANAFAATLILAQEMKNFYGLYWWAWDIHSANIPNDRQRYQTTGRKADGVLKDIWVKGTAPASYLSGTNIFGF